MVSALDEHTAKVRRAQKATEICPNHASTGHCFNHETGKKCGYRHEGGVRPEKDWANWKAWKKARNYRDHLAERILAGTEAPEEYEDWMDDPMKGYWRQKWTQDPEHGWIETDQWEHRKWIQGSGAHFNHLPSRTKCERCNIDYGSVNMLA
jgi:hypothetical protein